jgi:hypothetical protein
MKISAQCSLIALALCAVMAMPCQAQGEMSPWDVENGDLDGDGFVGPTDVQQVVNQALGMADEGPQAVNRNRRQFIVASPRASLALRPGVSPDQAEPCDTIGAVFNFPRRHGRMLVRTSTAVRFRYDKNVEGVWYDGACGLLRTRLVLDYTPIPADGVDISDLSNVEWAPIGEDKAEGRGCGPAIGTASIVVPYTFAHAGDFLVRARMATYAVPEHELAADVAFCGAAAKRNVVYIHVRVIGATPTEEQLRWYEQELAGPIHHEYGDLWQHGVDDTVKVPDVDE